MSHDAETDAAGFDAETEIAKLRSRIKSLERELLTAILAAIAVLAGIGLWMTFQKPPQPTAGDYTEAELLHDGPHCYGSAERGDGRGCQRALAAIDRQQRERKHLTTADPQPDPAGQFRGPSAAAGPVTEPSITAADSESDPSRCFQVVYRPRS